jgi:hypothetical protein
MHLEGTLHFLVSGFALQRCTVWGEMAVLGSDT